MPSSEIVFTVTESPEGGYEARAQGQSIFTHADSMDELRQEIRDAVCCHFDCDAAPVKIRLRGAFDEVINA
jgi:hypothetical protein